MPDNLPECPEHSHLRIRLEKIKEFHAETNSLIREDIEYLIGQAEWAISLDRAGQALNLSSQRYIAELAGRIAELSGKLAHETYGNTILRENINKLTDGKAFPTE